MSDCAQRKTRSTYLEDRRTIFDFGCLLPVEIIQQIVLYCVAYAAQENGLIVHGLCCVSNRLLYVVTDPHQSLAKMTEWAHKYIATKVNQVLGRSGCLFDPLGEHSTILKDPKASLEKLVELLVAPVYHRLVRRPEKWPGLWFSPEMLAGGSITAKKPNCFRDPDLPDEVTLTLEPLPEFEKAGYAKMLRDLMNARLKALWAWIQEERLTVLGAKKAEKRRWDRPWAVELERVKRFHVVGGKEGNPELWRKAWGEDRKFVREQREARALYVAGNQEVLFPVGTYWLRVHFLVKCKVERVSWYP